MRPADDPKSRSIPPADERSRDVVQPAEAAAAMATVVARLRRMAATLFRGDAALFGDSARH